MPARIEPVPMKPRRGLFVALMLVLAGWCGVMVAMYFRSVRPHQPPQRPRATAPAVAALVPRR
jgi:hypothetical protein